MAVATEDMKDRKKEMLAIMTERDKQGFQRGELKPFLTELAEKYGFNFSTVKRFYYDNLRSNTGNELEAHNEFLPAQIVEAAAETIEPTETTETTNETSYEEPLASEKKDERVIGIYPVNNVNMRLVKEKEELYFVAKDMFECVGIERTNPLSKKFFSTKDKTFVPILATYGHEPKTLVIPLKDVTDFLQFLIKSQVSNQIHNNSHSLLVLLNEIRPDKVEIPQIPLSSATNILTKINEKTDVAQTSPSAESHIVNKINEKAEINTPVVQEKVQQKPEEVKAVVQEKVEEVQDTVQETQENVQEVEVVEENTAIQENVTVPANPQGDVNMSNLTNPEAVLAESAPIEEYQYPIEDKNYEEAQMVVAEKVDQPVQENQLDKNITKPTMTTNAGNIDDRISKFIQETTPPKAPEPKPSYRRDQFIDVRVLFVTTYGVRVATMDGFETQGLIHIKNIRPNNDLPQLDLKEYFSPGDVWNARILSYNTPENNLSLSLTHQRVPMKPKGDQVSSPTFYSTEAAIPAINTLADKMMSLKDQIVTVNKEEEKPVGTIQEFKSYQEVNRIQSSVQQMETNQQPVVSAQSVSSSTVVSTTPSATNEMIFTESHPDFQYIVTLLCDDETGGVNVLSPAAKEKLLQMMNQHYKENGRISDFTIAVFKTLKGFNPDLGLLLLNEVEKKVGECL